MELSSDTFRENLFYRGLVVDNNDPNQLGRIKIRVHKFFGPNIESANLPWAVPAFSMFAGSGSGFGSFAVPANNSQVWVFFEEGDIYQPVYFAEAPTGVHGLPTERTTNYPNRRVLKSPGGFVIYLDDATKELKIQHPSGSYFKINGSGNIVISGGRVDIN